jgi:acyl-CoA oxidase
LAARQLSGIADRAGFQKQLLELIRDDYGAATDPAKSAALLRHVVKSEVLKYTDMRDAPEKFFFAHRLLASVGLNGFGVRATVQFNLFAGSILGLGGPEQVDHLSKIQSKGQLGCFLLTEMQAGVLSGLIVETTATWCPEKEEFLLHTPSDKAAKNWISQGYTAELGVVIADLIVDGKSHGPHPFFMHMRDEGGALMPGIRVEDMGHKTVANDLDNARVWFDHVALPKDALLNRFADIVDGKYVQTGDERMRIEVIGQRLLTGRQAIAEAALVCARTMHLKAEAYAKQKVCNGLAGETSLASMPQLASVFEESYAALDRMEAFAAGVEARLAKCLSSETIPDADLVEAIAVTKIKCIEVAIERCQVLRQEVGSYALMHGTGFELIDMLLCCKFAEGDSRILQQKLTRDRLKQLQKAGMGSALASLVSPDSAETMAALRLARKLAPAGRDLEKLSAAMNTHWREIYDLADHIAERHIRSGAPGQFEPTVERLIPAEAVYDHDWKQKLEAATYSPPKVQPVNTAPTLEIHTQDAGVAQAAATSPPASSPGWIPVTPPASIAPPA